jgi:hypothetical protein
MTTNDPGHGRGRGPRGRCDGRGQSQPPPPPSPPSSPDAIAIDLSGFEFSVTIHASMGWDRLQLPGKFASIVDGQELHSVVLHVSDGTTGLWSVEVLP